MVLSIRTVREEVSKGKVCLGVGSLGLESCDSGHGGRGAAGPRKRDSLELPREQSRAISSVSKDHPALPGRSPGTQNGEGTVGRDDRKGRKGTEHPAQGPLWAGLCAGGISARLLFHQ